MAAWAPTENSAPYQTAEFIVGGIVPMCLIVIGTVGNLTCVVILLNKENRRTTTNIYLVFLCIMDTISLYQWNLSHALDVVTDSQTTMWGQSLFICKLSEFFPFYSLHTSAMFLTFVELDRACLLRSAWYKRKIAQPRIALSICVIIMLVIFALNGFLFGLGYEYPTHDNKTGTYQTDVTCFYSMNSALNDFFVVQYAWVHLVVMYFLPFAVIIVCTLLTVNKLIRRQTLTNDQLAHSAQRNRRISIMLLLMCLTYIIATLPNRLCFSIFVYQILGHEYTDTVFLSSNTLMYTRNALNAFFLYISVVGFRRDLRNFISRCFGKRLLQVNPTTHTLTVAAANTRTTARKELGTALPQSPAREEQ